MRWFRNVAVSSCCLAATICSADEPQGAVIRNPFVAAPIADGGPPTPIGTQATWQGVVRPMSLAEPTPTNTASMPEPVARSLPSDPLLALRTAVRVRSTAEAYRAAPVSPRHDKTAAWTAPQPSHSGPMRDAAVKPAAWIEDTPSHNSRAAATTAVAPPQMLSEFTTSHQDATRLTLNPYRRGDDKLLPIITPPAIPKGDGNPLR